MGTLALSNPAQADPTNNSAATLTKAVTPQGVLRHLDAFQKIADANGGNRASGQPGHDASADYVAGLLENAGYQVARQPFNFNFFEEFGSSFARVAPPPATTFVDGTDYDLMDYSGSGDVTAPVVPVDLSLTPPRASTSGCEASDFAGFPAGGIALVQRGNCTFGIKVANAEAAGAIGAIVMNQGDGDPVANADRYNLFAGTLGAPVGIPAVSVSYARGEQFAGTPGLQVRITADTTSEVRRTQNVIAQTADGRTDNVVMAGAHLDSVTAGPGINDNGSGSAALLEVALQMAKAKTNNQVRFAWWGAEEANLVGSTFYVNSLSGAQRADIALYLNFDMVASPNYMLGVYDGDDSVHEGSGPGPLGSAPIEDVFQAYFAGRGLPTSAADFTGRSDYGPFIGAGIPAGGLFTGAEGLKSAADVAKYGGVQGAPYDACYHASCDTFDNLNSFALDVNADAIATAVITFAYDTSAVNGMPRSPGKSHGAGHSEDAHGHALI